MMPTSCAGRNDVIERRMLCGYTLCNCDFFPKAVTGSECKQATKARCTYQTGQSSFHRRQSVTFVHWENVCVFVGSTSEDDDVKS